MLSMVSHKPYTYGAQVPEQELIQLSMHHSYAYSQTDEQCVCIHTYNTILYSTINYYKACQTN